MIFSLPLAMIIIGGSVGIWSSIQDQEARKHKEECKQSQEEKSKQIELSTEKPLKHKTTKE